MNPRPTVITVFGVLNIVFGALALLCTPIALAGTILMHAQGGNPVMQAMHSNLVYRIWAIASGVVGLVAALALLLAGIGLLHLKPWARLVSIGYAIYAIIAGLVGAVITAIILLPSLQDAHGTTQSAALIGGMIGAVMGGMLGMVYPVVLLIFMTRPNVRAAFAGPGPMPISPAPPV